LVWAIADAAWRHCPNLNATCALKNEIFERDHMTNSPSQKTTANEEPEITQEDAVPSDGKDVEGEQMMKQISNKKLADHPEKSTASSEKSHCDKQE